MAETAIDLRSSHRIEADGSHTVTVTISGLPSLEVANKFSLFVRDSIRENAHKVGRLDTKRNEQ